MVLGPAHDLKVGERRQALRVCAVGWMRYPSQLMNPALVSPSLTVALALAAGVPSLVLARHLRVPRARKPPLPECHGSADRNRSPLPAKV